MNKIKGLMIVAAGMLAFAGRASAQWEQSQVQQAAELVRGAKALQPPPRHALDGLPIEIVIAETEATGIVRLTGFLKLTLDETRGCGPGDCGHYTRNHYTARLQSEAGKIYVLELKLYELNDDHVDGTGTIESVYIDAADGRNHYHWECPNHVWNTYEACGDRSQLNLNHLLSEGLYFEWTHSSVNPAHYRVQVEASFHVGDAEYP